MQAIRNIIANHIQGKKVLILFILANLVYAFMLIVTIPKTMAYSEGMKLPDMMPTGYDLAYINELFNALGENGREVYLFNQIPVDMIYPFLFAISYCLLMAFILNKLDKLHTGLFFFCLFPIFAGMADYLENLGTITMLNSYPEIPSVYATMTNIFTILKSTLSTVYFVALIIVLIVLGMRAIRKGKSVNESMEK
jgi:uncharacterized membrane protein YccF (DUF307 family)